MLLRFSVVWPQNFSSDPRTPPQIRGSAHWSTTHLAFCESSGFSWFCCTKKKKKKEFRRREEAASEESRSSPRARRKLEVGELEMCPGEALKCLLWNRKIKPSHIKLNCAVPGPLLLPLSKISSYPSISSRLWTNKTLIFPLCEEAESPPTEDEAACLRLQVSQLIWLLKVEDRTSEEILRVTPNLPAGAAYRRWRIIRLYLSPVWAIENGKQLLIGSCHTHFRTILDHHFYAIFVSACMKRSVALLTVSSCVCDPDSWLLQSVILFPLWP